MFGYESSKASVMPQVEGSSVGEGGSSCDINIMKNKVFKLIIIT